MNKNIDHILVSEESIKERVKEIGKQISEDFGEEPILAVCILKGSIIFYSDLVREISGDLQMAFVVASSYGADTVSSGKVEITNIMEIPIENRYVLIVEDIVDSGRTIARIRKAFEEAGATDVKVCTLLDKPERRVVDVDVDYTCFTVPDEFVVGYGLDYDQKFRNLPYIGVLKREVYE